jgi:hypothetical protein
MSDSILNDLLLVFAAIGSLFVTAGILSVVTPKLTSVALKSYKLNAIKMYYYDALGCEIDAGYTFVEGNEPHEINHKMQRYVDERFKDGTVLYWEVVSLEDK